MVYTASPWRVLEYTSSANSSTHTYTNMKVLIVLSAVVAISLAKPGYLAGGIAARLATPVAAPYYSTVVAAPAVVSEQHHAQDTLGQYRYGYSDGLSTKGEFRTADGVTRGAYAYVDSEGKVQNVAYTADAAGFRVSASNLPEAPAVPEAPELRAPEPVQDTAEVAAAKAAHEVAVKEAEAKAAAPAVVSAPALTYSSIAAPAIGYSSIAAPAIGYSSYAAPAFGYSAYGVPAVGYSAVAPASGFAYSTVSAAPAYTTYAAAPAVNIVPQAGVPTLTAAGVPVDTVEVQAARAADAAAHLRAKGLIL